MGQSLRAQAQTVFMNNAMVMFVIKLTLVVSNGQLAASIQLSDTLQDVPTHGRCRGHWGYTLVLRPDKSIEQFNKAAMKSKHIKDMVAKAVLAVRYIISLDDTIDNERKETFKKYLGMYKDEFLQQTIFDVPDFFTRVLLYTTCVDNKEGQPYVKKVTDTLIEEVANDNWAELRWDAVAQTLELVSTGEKRLSDWVEQLCQLRPPITAGKYLTTRWLGVNMTDLDPSIWGRTKIRDTDAQRLLSRKINPYAHITSPECRVNSLSPKPNRVFKVRSDKESGDT